LVGIFIEKKTTKMVVSRRRGIGDIFKFLGIFGIFGVHGESVKFTLGSTNSKIEEGTDSNFFCHF